MRHFHYKVMEDGLMLNRNVRFNNKILKILARITGCGSFHFMLIYSHKPKLFFNLFILITST